MISKKYKQLASQMDKGIMVQILSIPVYRSKAAASTQIILKYTKYQGSIPQKGAPLYLLILIFVCQKLFNIIKINNAQTNNKQFVNKEELSLIL